MIARASPLRCSRSSPFRISQSPLAEAGPGWCSSGTKTSGLANAILAPAFGIFLLIYALGIWRRRRSAVPMAWIYAAYVPINLALFTIKTPRFMLRQSISMLVARKFTGWENTSLL
jgi:hypothetical protein